MTPSPEEQLAGFIAKFDDDVAALATAARAKLRERYSAAYEIVYDNYNALAIGFGPNERTSEAAFSIAVTPRGPVIYFTHGRKLPDPTGIVLGEGKQGGFVRITELNVLDDPAVMALLTEATALGKTEWPTIGQGPTIIKSISAKQRPRRAVTKTAKTKKKP